MEPKTYLITLQGTVEMSVRDNWERPICLDLNQWSGGKIE